MKKTCLFLALAILGLAAPVRAQDPLQTAPGAFKEKLNNAEVRVTEYTSTPGQKDAMHSHPAMMIYVVAGGKMKSTAADGTSKVMEFATGDVRWMPPMTHTSENVGTTEIRILLVEVKHPKK
jgi:oxalate decarboxylase/phosphoglucose isomerase-like protein (cupin superfamily)